MVIVYALEKKRADVSEDVYSLHAVLEIVSGGQRETFAVEISGYIVPGVRIPRTKARWKGAKGAEGVEARGIRKERDIVRERGEGGGGLMKEMR